MEPVTTLYEGEWNSFNGVYSNEEADFMAQLLGNFSLPNEIPNISPIEVPSTFWPPHEPTIKIDEIDEASLYYSTNTHDFSQENSYTDGNSNFIFPSSSDKNYFQFSCSRDGESSISSIPSLSNNQMSMPEQSREDSLSPSSRKRSCSLANDYKSREKRKSPKLSVKGGNKDEDEHDGSDDDSNGSQELNVTPRPAIPNSNGKTRAGRGSATDPQSVYARKRRERINERLRILQTLVPNGTKVDISTMLEEAVQYVKFLQLQIKLLSSDDLWMYAPIAYNGMDIGLDLKISSLR